MNKTIAETRAFLRNFIPAVQKATDVDIIIAPPFTSLSAAADEIKDTDIQLAAQDIFWEEKGAYTGEISPIMLLDAGCKQVIIGHSERRQYFSEEDVIVNRKIKAAKTAGLGVIFCVGEALEEREAGKTFDVIKREVEMGLAEIDPENLVVAYEPIWAIGTGKTATTEQAQEMHAHLRSILAGQYGEAIAKEIPVLYGGSVKANNAKEIFNCPDVDGGLVGGASLIAADFIEIIRSLK